MPIKKGHPPRWRSNKIATYSVLSPEDTDEIANILGDVSRIDSFGILTELSGIGFKYKLVCQARSEPTFSEQRSQFTKIKNAADELLRHLFAEDPAEDPAKDRIVQSEHFWGMPKALLVPLRQATEFEVRVLHKEWQEEWRMWREWPEEGQEEGQEEPDYDPNLAPLPYPHDIERQGAKNRINAPLNAAIWAVRLIRRAAATAERAATSLTKPGRGGKRNEGKRHEVVLLESLFQFHYDLHCQDPTHIGPPSVNTTPEGDIRGVTLNFIVAYLAILKQHTPELSNISDNTIRHRFRDWQAKSRIRE